MLKLSQARARPEQVEVEVAVTMNPESDQSDSGLEAEVDDIMYRVFGDFEPANKASECDNDTDSCSTVTLKLKQVKTIWT